MAIKSKNTTTRKHGRFICPQNAPARKLELSITSSAPIAYIKGNRVWAMVRQGVYKATDLTVIADYYKTHPIN